MPRLTKIYTRTGDKGETGLVGGHRVPKDSLRIEAYGTVDELNAALGVVRAFCHEAAPQTEATRELDGVLRGIQNTLFNLGAELATLPADRRPGMPEVAAEHVKFLELLIDECNAELVPPTEFVLPGGGKISAFLHQARTVCRRAERLCVRLGREDNIGAQIVPYLNRLSDALFVLARWIAHKQGEPEFCWEHLTPPPTRPRKRTV
jgi:cob(I)alamin adenosyltransferase